MKLVLNEKSVVVKEIKAILKYAKNDTVKISVNEDHLILQAGSHDLYSTKTVIDSVVEKDDLVTIFTVEQVGEMFLDSHVLSVISNLIEQEVTLLVSENLLNIQTKTVNLKLNLKSNDDFISAPVCELSPYFPILKKSFYSDLLTNIGYACEVEEKTSRPILRGIQIASNGERVIATATDSHRAALFNVELKTNEIPSIVVPYKNLADALLLFGEDEIVTEYSNEFLVLKQENVTVYVKLLDGNYPNVAPLFTVSETAYKVQLEVKTLNDVLKLIDAFGNISKEKSDNKKIVRFTATEKGLNVKCIHQGGEFETVLPLVNVAGTLSDTFNVKIKYLKEAIATGKETLFLMFDGPKLYVSTIPSLQQVVMGTRVN